MSSDEINPVLRRLGIPDFRPFPLFGNGHLQTLTAALLPELSDLKPTSSSQIRLPDGDRLVILENRPERWEPGDRIVVLVHGLAGCHQSGYMIRLARKLTNKGYLSIRVNLRGCGSGFGMARKPYHSGRSEDLREIQNWLVHRYPSSPVTQVGFSLGANITLKMVGEDGERPSGNLDSVVAVSPPAHLSASASKLRQSSARIYRRYFLKKLFADVTRARKVYPDIPQFNLWDRMHLTDFDELYTAPQSGYKSAEEYYEKAASLPLIPSIRVPTLILTSTDDPVVDVESIRSLQSHPGLDVVVTNRGGHVGFLSRTLRQTGIRWMDAVVLKWLGERPRKHRMSR